MRNAMVIGLCLAVGACTSEPDKRRVFVTSAKFNGDLGGLAGGDARCQSVADAASAAGLGDFDGATWTAWLSTGSVRAIDRLPDDGPWTRVSLRTTVFRNKAHVALAPAQLSAAIGTDERGNLIPDTDATAWTGTLPGGVPHAGNCVGWTSTSVTDIAGIGSATSTRDAWTASGQDRCNLSFRLICFER